MIVDCVRIHPRCCSKQDYQPVRDEKGGGWPFSYNHTETSSAESNTAESHTAESHTAESYSLSTHPKLQRIVHITKGFLSAETLGRCAP